MADLTYSAGLTNGISPELKKIQTDLKNTQDIFSKFQSAIAGIAIGGFIVSAVKMAAALDDVATASGIALGTVVGFGQAVAANGGSIEGANQAIGRFAKFISSASEGNREAQETFQKLGISLSDLGRLSEEDLMKKTISGLAATNDNALRTAKGMEIFGKSFNSVDFKGVNAGLDGFIQRAGPAASAIKAAADAEQNFATAINSFQISLLSALEPISKFVAALDPQKIEAFIQTLVNLGVALGSLFVFNKLTGIFATFTNELSKNGSVIKSLSGMLNGLTGGSVASAQQGVKNLKIEWMELGSIFSKTGKGVEATSGPLSKIMSLFGGIGMAISRMLPLIGQIISAFLVLDGVIKLISGKGITTLLDEAGAKMASLLGISYKTAEAKREEEAATKAAADAQQKQADAATKTRDVVDTIGVAYKTLVADLQKGVDAYMASNAAIVERLKLDGELIGLTEQQKAVKQALFDVESKNQAELTRLQELYAQKSQSSKQEDLRLLPDIEKAMEKVRGSLEGQKRAVEDLVVANAARLEQENQLKALADFTGSTQIANAKKLRDLQHEMATSTMGEIQKKYADIAYAADESARAEIEKENSRRNQLGLIKMTADEEAKYYAASKQGLNEIAAAARQQIQQSRTWSAGWGKAWRDYADDATNAAKTAESIFKKTTSGIEDAIVGLVKTGKFEWKSMLSSIAEELLRSGIRKSITGLFEGLGGGGDSLLGKVGKMFGLEGMFGGSAGASGQGASSNNPLYVYDVAGGGNRPMGGGGGGGQQSGGGGGWWDQITESVSGVWDSVTSGIGDVWDSVSNGIGDIFGGGGGSWFDDIASGIGSLFGGFFANGGQLGAGKFGIAGENGPEMISGPATITPLGGSTNVTYNINAVDAASFKAMIAADPSFIHAVAMQGGRGIARRY
jgi:lambda family phage tail tape measure protein